MFVYMSETFICASADQKLVPFMCLSIWLSLHDVFNSPFPRSNYMITTDNTNYVADGVITFSLNSREYILE